jgi:integrase
MDHGFVIPTAPAKGLNPKFITGLKPNPDGLKYEVGDTGETSNLCIRVTPRAKTFYMSARWKPGASSATSRKLGMFAEAEDKIPGPGYITLAQAREKAREWEAIRKAGIDPREKEQLEANERAAERPDFEVLAEAYLATPEFRKQRQSKATERSIRYDLLNPARNPWMHKTVSDIDDADVAIVIAAIRDKRQAPVQARHVLAYLKLIFSFRMLPENRKRYGLKAHPIAHLKPEDFRLPKSWRQRVLDDDETVAVWRAADRLGYPYGPLYKLLLANGARKSEIGKASWPEIDLVRILLIIPVERFKSEAPHIVPLSDLSLEVLATLPRFEGKGTGSFLFSTTNGMKPVNGFSNAKKRPDRYAQEELRKIAKGRGKDPMTVTFKKFINHDLRRTVRTNLSRLRVAENVAELTIGHGKQGLERIYNLHEYLDEMREALQAWADRLRMLLATTPG